MRSIWVKCTDRHTTDSVNGPLTRVTLTPHGPFNVNTGSITLFVNDAEDLQTYQVGKEFLLTPKTI